MNVESAAEPYFDELTNAVAAQYGALAPWSPRFQIEAFKRILSGIDEIKENSRRSLDAHAVTHDKLDTLSSKLAEVAHQENKANRVFFGSRPDMAAENRFVERSEQEQLNALIADPTRRRTVLVGMRGCGKTQLAASLAKQCEDANWNLVAWINAVSHESIQSDLVELAKKLEINTSDQPTPETIIHRYFDQLESEVPSDRLIVFDNVENIDDLRELVPRGSGLRVVATTTNNTGWEHQGWETIKVGVFDRDESIKYLLSVTKSDDHDTADVLAKRLGDLPLAIAQAAAFAQKRKLDLAQYLDRLDAYRSGCVMPAVPGDYYARDVATALRVAIDATLNELEASMSQAARHHLGALALLAESGVPTRWIDPLTEGHHYQDPRDRDRAEDDNAHDALTELIDRSIIQQSADGSMTMLHRLQAQALRESWSERERKQAYESASTLLGSVDLEDFPRNATDLLRRETRDLIEQLYTLSTQDHSCLLLEREEARTCLRRVFRFAHELGLSYEALTLQPVVEILQDLLSSLHPEILALRSSLASLYESAGDTDEAIILHEHVLTDSICALGGDHPVTLSARNSLASSYLSVGRLREAITHFEQVLADSLRILGEDHPQTLIARINLAGAYDSAGRSDDAISLLEDVLSNSLRVLGEDHPYTLSARNNLASAYQSAGQLSEAIAHFEQVLADSLHILGEDHPQTLSTRNNLASTYESAGQLSAAITMQEQVLTGSIRVLGEDHPDTLISRNNLASAYESAGRTDEAIILYEQVFTDRSRLLGEDHPKTLASRNNLAYTYLLMGRTEDAISHFEQTLIKSTRALGEEHPLTVSARENLEIAMHVLEQRKDDAPTD